MWTFIDGRKSQCWTFLRGLELTMSLVTEFLPTEATKQYVINFFVGNKRKYALNSVDYVNSS